MTGLLGTFLGSADEPNTRGDVDRAAWRFVLPHDFDRVEWRWSGPGHERDLETIAKHATVVPSSAPPLLAVNGQPPNPRPARLLVGAAPDVADPSDSVSIQLRSGRRPVNGERRLELRYVGDELQGVAPLDDLSARAILSGHVGEDGQLPRSLKQRIKGVPRRTRRTEIGSLHGVPEGPPAWLVTAAAEAGLDVSGHGWGLWCRGDFGSQKLVMFLIAPGASTPSIAVKIVRDPRFNDRLEHESDMLRLIEGLDARVRGGAPTLLFETKLWGSAASAQSMVRGSDLRRNLARRPELLTAVTTWMSDLAIATRAEIDRSELRGGLDELLGRYVAAYDVPQSAVSFLRGQAELLTETELFAVLQHGDAGPWNALLTDDGTVAFLDWEAGEPRGLPLWDLIYFHRSASLLMSRSRPWENRRVRLRRDLIAGSPIGDRVASEVGAYVDAIGLDRRAVEPLYHLCWVQRAIKEARRIPAERRPHGMFHRFLLDGIDGRDLPGLRRITLRTERVST